MAMNKKIALVLLASGSSTRMGGQKKEYAPLKGGTVLSEALKPFLLVANESSFNFTVLVTIREGGGEAEEKKAKAALFENPEVASFCKNGTLLFTEGGSTRQKSVYKALSLLSTRSIDAVLIHDGARPFVSANIVRAVLSETLAHGAAVPAITPVDTQKEADAQGYIKCHLRRENLAAVQTPQGFMLEPLLACHKMASLTDVPYTDDSEIWDSFPKCTGGIKVRLVPGEPKNRKITFKDDLQGKNNMLRIGLGTDLHTLSEGRRFLLGGVEIPSAKGEVGHSDGDVLLHAITDALLGAAGLGDIGSYFPSESEKWKDSDSALLLKTVWRDITASGFTLVNLDCVVECEKPKILPFRNEIRDSIAQILSVDIEQVFIKAKTNEKQDAVGRNEAVKAYCVCLLQNS